MDKNARVIAFQKSQSSRNSAMKRRRATVSHSISEIAVQPQQKFGSNPLGVGHSISEIAVQPQQCKACITYAKRHSISEIAVQPQLNKPATPAVPRHSISEIAVQPQLVEGVCVDHALS